MKTIIIKIITITTLLTSINLSVNATGIFNYQIPQPDFVSDDWDGDGVPNISDPDDDNDGVDDEFDDIPFDRNNGGGSSTPQGIIANSILPFSSIAAGDDFIIRRKSGNTDYLEILRKTGEEYIVEKEVFVGVTRYNASMRRIDISSDGSYMGLYYSSSNGNVDVYDTNNFNQIKSFVGPYNELDYGSAGMRFKTDGNILVSTKYYPRLEKTNGDIGIYNAGRYGFGFSNNGIVLFDYDYFYKGGYLTRKISGNYSTVDKSYFTRVGYNHTTGSIIKNSFEISEDKSVVAYARIGGVNLMDMNGNLIKEIDLENLNINKIFGNNNFSKIVVNYKGTSSEEGFKIIDVQTENIQTIEDETVIGFNGEEIITSVKNKLETKIYKL